MLGLLRLITTRDKQANLTLPSAIQPTLGTQSSDPKDLLNEFESSRPPRNSLGISRGPRIQRQSPRCQHVMITIETNKGGSPWQTTVGSRDDS